MLGRNAGARLVADGARVPLRDGCADLVCYAQAWHWLDHELASAETARMLRPGGTWAGWWNHIRADGEPWFEAYFDVLEARSDARRAHRDTDWGATIDRSWFEDPTFVSVPWVRRLSLDEWRTDQRSHSYIGLVDGGDAVMAELETIVRDHFGDGPLAIRYETWLWQATTR